MSDHTQPYRIQFTLSSLLSFVVALAAAVALRNVIWQSIWAALIVPLGPALACAAIVVARGRHNDQYLAWRGACAAGGCALFMGFVASVQTTLRLRHLDHFAFSDWLPTFAGTILMEGAVACVAGASLGAVASFVRAHRAAT